jgi:membrane protease YdiL (CAAX protease family)
MSTARFLLAVASVFLLGTAAGALAHHPGDGSGYALPIVLAVLGVVAALCAWKMRKPPA